MAPEQALGLKLDQRADLFSLGSVLYQMLSGRPPFRAASTLAVLKRVTEDMPRPIIEIIPETPQWLCDIITKLLAKKPEERYQSAQEVAGVLKHCEDQVKTNAKLQDFSKIPRVTTAPSSGRSKWFSAAVVLFPLVALAATELAGITHLLKPGVTERDLVVRGAEVSSQPAVILQAANAEPTNADGFVALFNGKDLTGWKTHPDAPGRWEVKDGILIGSDRRGFIFSERGDFANFHLRAEAKINQRGVSGVFFRTRFGILLGKEEWNVGVPGGYAAEIHKNPNFTRKTGSVAAVQNDAPPRILGLAAYDSLTQPNEWFTLEIIAEQNRFITKVNGHETANCSDPFHKDSSGHIALNLFTPITRVEFRTIEIKELPASDSSPAPLSERQFASNVWIDVIPLIDPKLDKWDMRMTGKNEWRIEQGELIVGGADDKPNKLLLPLDADFRPSFECELEVTRRAGEHGFNLNFPNANGDTSMNFDPPGKPGVFVRYVRTGPTLIAEGSQIETGKRTTIRIELRHQADGDRITVWNNGTQVGTWAGDRNELASFNNEGYPHQRRISLWTYGPGSVYAFHRIRFRMLDGGTVQSVRPIPAD